MSCAVTLLALCLATRIHALVLDFNTIRSSAEIQQAPAQQEPQCASDAECGPGQFCLSSRREQPACSQCRGTRKRCHRDAMCCDGSHCLNNVCTASDAQAAERQSKEGESRNTNGSKKPKRPHTQRVKEARPKNEWEKVENRQTGKGLEGETCLRTSDCSAGLCCARHFWSKICRPVLKEGQVCSKRGRKDGPQGPEIFQRCACGPGLACRHQNEDSSQGNSRLRVCQRV
ncbi:dickkopf-related protein 4-like [Leucoraja erinacea]|uniref:dickkopf-related protein 4-like n=1 Tax=Leucoraja erinaceus TaxID=7782 RepID=UPI0024543DFB|nr:dickkopf-related protein 4-like [Leucoraja erinacea]